MPRLSNASLPQGISTPGYDRAAVATGIVHLGLGAFHRAHQAVYTEAVLEAGDRRWGITAASLRSPATRDALAPQDGLYTFNIRRERDDYAVIGAVQRIMVAPEDPAALIRAMCAPSIAIVSLTVTEKAYCRDPATGALDEAHEDVQHDLLHPNAPRSVLGLLTAAIAQRRAAGLPPFTVLCCDNLPANGHAVHGVLSRFASLRDPGLGAFVTNEITCPDTMVDRIVPATTEEDRARISAALGVEDVWPVIAEPFTQWVIADRFPAGRPEWERAGATMVSDVAPFEAMKLRLLNAAHSALAYVGYLAGHETVADAMADPALAGLAAAVMEDATPTLHLPPGTDVAGYKRSLLERFRNPALRHRLWQIAADGSQKLPPRILGTVADRLAAGLPIDAHARVIAAWMRFVSGHDAAGCAIDVRDPLAGTMAQIAATVGLEPTRLVPAMLAVSSVFGPLSGDQRLLTAVSEAFTRLGPQPDGSRLRRSAHV